MNGLNCSISANVVWYFGGVWCVDKPGHVNFLFDASIVHTKYPPFLRMRSASTKFAPSARMLMWSLVWTCESSVHADFTELIQEWPKPTHEFVEPSILSLNSLNLCVERKFQISYGNFLGGQSPSCENPENCIDQVVVKNSPPSFIPLKI